MKFNSKKINFSGPHADPDLEQPAFKGQGACQNRKHPQNQRSNKDQKDLQQFIGTTLRWGVLIACAIALLGGVYYLLQAGGNPAPDYSTFQRSPSTQVTWSGIWQGVLHLQAEELILLGVIVLIFTPVLRVVLSLVTFLLERDWLYVFITFVVFLIIIINMLEGVGG